ncbi:hypothetical protein L1049_012604 [Liquidambar formosana]|uniref:Uncharacterized protein n=1 Tax=Liquidambar formosana TaxID=63359 RepID=A0AAP0N1U5_LIQFO
MKYPFYLLLHIHFSIVSNEGAKEELSGVDCLTEERVDKVVKGFLEDVEEDLLEAKAWPVAYSAYVVSKAALNAYTRILAKKLPDFCVNSVGPGFVKTDLTYNNGVYTVQEGAKCPVMLALMPDGGPSGQVAVVTRANRGIGLEISRQFASNGIIVILTCRDEKKGIEAVESLRAFGLSSVFHQLDIAGANSGLLKNILKQTYETAENCVRTNYFGIRQVTEALIPLLQVSNLARIVNVSSSLGQFKLISNEKAKELGDADGLTEEKVDEVVKGFLEDVKEDLVETKGWPINVSAYIVSKAALNAYTRVLAKKYPNFPINAVNPSYVQIELNYNTGVLTVEEGAKGPVMLALMPDGGPPGLFFDRWKYQAFD